MRSGIGDAVWPLARIDAIDELTGRDCDDGNKLAAGARHIRKALVGAAGHAKWQRALLAAIAVHRNFAQQLLSFGIEDL